MKKRLIIIFLFIPFLFIAQVDCVRARLNAATGRSKVKLLDTLVTLDSVLFYDYHKQALSLARQLKDSAGEVNTWIALGDHYYDRTQPDSATICYSAAAALAKKYALPHESIVCLDRSAAAMEENSLYEKASALYTEAIAESRTYGDKNDLSDALEKAAIFCVNQRDDSAAFTYFAEQLALEKELNDSSDMAVCLNNIGLLHFYRGEYADCLGNYKESLLIEQKLNEDNATAQSLLNIGITYKNEGDYESALQNLLDAAQYFEKGEASKELGSCYNTIGAVYTELNETEKALSYYFQSLFIRKKIGNKRGIAGSYTNIGDAYKTEGKYDLALYYTNCSIPIKEEIGDKALLASSLDQLGEIYFLKSDYTNAEIYYLRSMELRKDIEDPKGKATTLNNLAQLYVAWKKYDKAISNLDDARTIAAAMGAKNILLNNYDITVKALQGKGDLKGALLFYDQYTALKDTLFNEEKNKALTEMQVKYETQKKEQRIILMNEQARSQSAIVSRQHTFIYSLIAGTFLLIVVALLSFQAYRSGRKANKQSRIIIEQKQQIIEQKQSVMKELHHRVKNNLQTLSSLLNLQQQRLADPEARNAIKAVNQRLNAMLLIHQDLYTDHSNPDVNMKDYILKLVDNLVTSFGYPPGKLQLNLHAENITLDPDRALTVGFICNEIISNSFKYAFPGTDKSELDIQIVTENDELLFRITDNGKGMPSSGDIEKKNSFGLKLISLFVKDISGSLRYSSTDQGTVFEFNIPANK